MFALDHIILKYQNVCGCICLHVYVYTYVGRTCMYTHKHTHTDRHHQRVQQLLPLLFCAVGGIRSGHSSLHQRLGARVFDAVP